MLRKVLLGLGLIFSLGAAPAIGQPADDPAKAMAKYEEAERYYKLAEFETALALYRESYLLSGEPELLFNIGQCNRQLKRYEEALKSYKAYLRDVPSSPARADIEVLIKEVEGKLGPQPASAPTSAPASQPASQNSTRVEPPTSDPILSPALSKPGVRQVWAESLTAKVGAGFLGASFIMGGVALGGALKAQKSEDRDVLLFIEAQQRATNIAHLSDACLLAGGALLAVGWFFQRNKEQTPQISVGVGAGSALAALRLEF